MAPQKIVISNTQEDYENAIREDPHGMIDTFRLDNTRQLFGINEAQFIILPGAEDHPLLQNARVKQLQSPFRPPNAKPKEPVEPEGEGAKVPGDALGDGDALSNFRKAK